MSLRRHTMNPTEEMLQEINGFLSSVGDPALTISEVAAERPEIELLNAVRQQYIKRLRQKMPLYRLVPRNWIQDVFLMALNRREEELKSKP